MVVPTHFLLFIQAMVRFVNTPRWLFQANLIYVTLARGRQKTIQFLCIRNTTDIYDSEFCHQLPRATSNKATIVASFLVFGSEKLARYEAEDWDNVDIYSLLFSDHIDDFSQSAIIHHSL